MLEGKEAQVFCEQGVPKLATKDSTHQAPCLRVPGPALEGAAHFNSPVSATLSTLEIMIGHHNGFRFVAVTVSIASGYMKP